MNILLSFLTLTEIPHYSDFLNLYSGNFVSRGFFISNFLNESDFIKKSPAFFKNDTLSFSLFFTPYLEEKDIKKIPYFLSFSLIFPLKNLITGIDFDLLSKEKFMVYSGNGEVLKNYTPQSFYVGTFFSKKIASFITGIGIGISKVEEPQNIWPYEPEVFYLPSLNLGISSVYKNADFSFSILNIADNLKKRGGGKISSPLNFCFNSSFNLNFNNLKIVPGLNFERIRNYKGEFKNYYGAGLEFIKKGNLKIYFDTGYILRENKGFVFGIKIKYYDFKVILSETGLLTDYRKIDLNFGMEIFFELIEI